MSITRTTLARVPGHIKFGASAYLYSRAPIEVVQRQTRSPIVVDGIGRIEDRPTDNLFEITVQPAGEFEHLSTWFPYASTVPGASIFGATDTALIIQGRDGKKRTFHCAALTGMSLSLRTGQPLINNLTFTAILKNEATPGAANAYYTLEASEAYPGDANFDKSLIITPPLSAAWGSAPWDEFWAAEGWDINFNLSLEPETVDGLGTIDMKFVDLVVEATGTPVGVTMVDVFAAAGADDALGSSPAREDLIISGTGFHFTLYDATAQDASAGFGATRRVPGSLKWVSNRAQTTGATNPVFRLAASAPA